LHPGNGEFSDRGIRLPCVTQKKTAQPLGAEHHHFLIDGALLAIDFVLELERLLFFYIRR
jgi:hypothetical protein